MGTYIIEKNTILVQPLSLRELIPAEGELVIPAPNAEEEEDIVNNDTINAANAADPAENTSLTTNQDISPEQTPSPVQKDPAFSLAELEAAKQQAFEEGKQAGISDGRHAALSEMDNTAQALQENILTTMNNLHTKMNTLFTAAEEDNPKKFIPFINRLALNIAKKVTNNQLGEHSVQDIEQFSVEIIEMLFNEPKLTLFVHSKIIPFLDEKMASLKQQQSFQGIIELKQDDNLQNTECRIAWDNGYVSYSGDDIWTSIESILYKESSFQETPLETPSQENENNKQQL